MIQSITVLDENGEVIGDTYPKRAKGLVKKGRAVYVDKITIRMTQTEVCSEGEPSNCGN